MNKNNRDSKSEVGVCYGLFKTYLRFLHDKVYYRRTWSLNKENIPASGTPLIIVGNHQNCLNDVFGTLFSINDRKVRFLTRADVFELSPLAAKFLYSIGLMPTFRLDFEGADSLEKNKGTFDVTEQALADGCTIGMYPEAGHQDKRWLGHFSYGYTRLAFEAAEKTGFEKDVVILPVGNHYSDYFGIRNEYMAQFGTPISLKPYYELYKTKPRTAQREVSALVRKQIENLMLDIRDLEHYDMIDFLRNTYGIGYALECGLNPGELPQKLKSDKAFVKALADCDTDVTGQIYDMTGELMDGLRETGIADRCLEKAPCLAATVLKTLGMAALLPLWIVSLWPSLPMYLIAEQLAKRTHDKMFEGTFLFAISALFTIPIFGILTVVLLCCFAGWWTGLVWLAAFPALVIFAWTYCRWSKKLFEDMRFHAYGKSAKVKKLAELRKNIHEALDRCLKVDKKE
ncbi:MAG: 1-acyl-sn-glycerol-3-phosphate acyltransferase [Candidatus Cryptobacteroides sp.]